MKNTIAERILDFLKNHPPFHFLSLPELMEIAMEIEVIYVENNEVIFDKESKLKNHFYTVKDGAIGLYNDEILADKCDEGDVFGLRAFIQQDNYALKAKAIEETILYCIPLEKFSSIIHNNQKVLKFLSTYYKVNQARLLSSKSETILFKEQIVSTKISDSFTEVQSANYSKNPITCSLTTSVKEAAITMSLHKVGSIVIVDDKLPLGIITDKDLRNKIATGKVSIDANVCDIMSSPVLTFHKNLSVAEAQIEMLKHQISHLCITKDGTINSELIGILSEHDVVVVHGNNPSVLIKEIKRSKTVAQLKNSKQKSQILLKNYIHQQIPIRFITSIISEINTSITQKIIDFALHEIQQKPPVPFSWIAIGSQGRKEQLLITDQDNALIFADTKDVETTKNYFLKLAAIINKNLAVIGFELCPAQMMASNPKWCLSVTEWQQQFNNWITKPTEDKILLSNIFFDYTLVYGDLKLVEALSESIFKSIASYEIFLNYLGRNALQNPPPLSFFRNFLVENSGEHKNQFDIKARAIMPLVDAARLLSLSHQIKNINSTQERFQKLGKLEPQNKDLYESCEIAFNTLLHFRTQEGLENNNSGRYIDISLLSKTNRLQLKNCFKPIKEIQELIQTRFKLSQFL